MKSLFGLTLILLLSACATPPTPPPPDPTNFPLGIRSIAVGPVDYATYQPNEQCDLFIDEDFRSALIRGLRQRGYDAFSVGGSVPRSFAAGSPPPQPGDPPPAGLKLAPDADAFLSVWIDHYWEHSLCGTFMGADQHLTMGAVAVVYVGSPPVEVWRGRAEVVGQGIYSGRDLIWLVTSRLTDRLLRPLPAGPGWTKQ